MRFLCVKLSTQAGDLVSYGQIPAYKTNPEVLLWEGRIFRLEVVDTHPDDPRPWEPLVLRLPVPGLDGDRKVVHYVEAWATSCFATLDAEGKATRTGMDSAQLMEPDVLALPEAIESPPGSILPMYVSDGSSIVVDAIAGGACSTDGVPDSLTLCLTDAEGVERRERYTSDVSGERTSDTETGTVLGGDDD